VKAKAKLYCVVPRDLAEKLHEPLREHFSEDSTVDVVVERRMGERRCRIRHDPGGRIADRRAASVVVDPPSLPRRARRYADRLVFLERLEPVGVEDEDLDTRRVISAFQRGDREAFSTLYLRYFDTIFRYMHVALRDMHEAEDATQQVFLRTFQSLAAFDVHREVPFRAWLIRVARNQTIDHLRKHTRLVAADPARIAAWRDNSAEAEEAINWTLGWLSDGELLLLIDRLPALQRQVIALRFMLGFTTDEIAEALNRSPDHVRKMQSRALGFLGDRLTALGRRSLRSTEEGSMVLLRQAPVLRRRRFCLSGRASPLSAR
jgi:RNA polymerase sigma-70 factor (ECF subfamily)